MHDSLCKMVRIDMQYIFASSKLSIRKLLKTLLFKTIKN